MPLAQVEGCAGPPRRRQPPMTPLTNLRFVKQSDQLKRKKPTRCTNQTRSAQVNNIRNPPAGDPLPCWRVFDQEALSLARLQGCAGPPRRRQPSTTLLTNLRFFKQSDQLKRKKPTRCTNQTRSAQVNNIRNPPAGDSLPCWRVFHMQLCRVTRPADTPAGRLGCSPGPRRWPRGSESARR